eukprot:TRINITY_DN2952_c1_g3_i1.p1 TRINITY_DN2952_c1_g3~~TRINITY_DN2952_c1_g3_i1.p1  ORF type:complete len:213 (-),score=-20.66 TRINITY_DN2952_c1_g3_i1:31-669(-)
MENYVLIPKSKRERTSEKLEKKCNFILFLHLFSESSQKTTKAQFLHQISQHINMKELECQCVSSYLLLRSPVLLFTVKTFSSKFPLCYPQYSVNKQQKRDTNLTKRVCFSKIQSNSINYILMHVRYIFTDSYTYTLIRSYAQPQIFITQQSLYIVVPKSYCTETHDTAIHQQLQQDSDTSLITNYLACILLPVQHISCFTESKLEEQEVENA